MKKSSQKKLDLEKLDDSRRNFIDEFKEFINRGSVMDLAIGVIIGGAFTTIVNSLVNDILMPVLSLVGGGADFSHLTIIIPNFFGTGDQAVIAYGSFLQNIINFLIIAFCVFLLVRALNTIRKHSEKSKEKKVEEKKASDPNTELLKEIRDLLSKNSKKSK